MYHLRPSVVDFRLLLSDYYQPTLASLFIQSLRQVSVGREFLQRVLLGLLTQKVVTFLAIGEGQLIG